MTYQVTCTPYQPDHKQQQYNYDGPASQLAESRGGQGKSPERFLQAGVIQTSGCRKQKHLLWSSTIGVHCSLKIIVRLLKDTGYTEVYVIVASPK